MLVCEVVCVTVSWVIIAFLVAIIVSCSVSKIPLAKYIASPAVTGSVLVVLSELEVSLNCTSPVENLGLPEIYGSGIVNVPSTLPFVAEINGLPATIVESLENPLDGVT